ncbi:unnamed protein product [Phyllotreta striolata]|uniref:TsaA-like domain-containing protein n=1 Tax=Phyllotreta striolata TaxID=444603 RepID=A0A9N9TSR8_PHYSR|nr:unnamed protein product [Phyllotreta striolata]
MSSTNEILDATGSSDSLDPNNLQKQLEIARREINNLRQQLTALNHVHRKELDFINKKLSDWQCTTCKTNQATALESPTPTPSDFSVNYIGKINTNFPEKRGTPRQPGICKDSTAKLLLNNVFTNPAHALQGLQDFSHMWILFHFHKNDSNHSKAKIAPPRLNGARTGVFATRSPHRPAPIGLSLVKIDRIMDNTIYFSGVDMINDTPVIDIKPYIPQYDNPVYLNTNDLSTPSTSRTVDRIPTVHHTISTDNTQILYNERTLEGEENERRDEVLGAAVANTDPSRNEVYSARSSSRMGEREAPDGEEEEPPRNPQASAIDEPAVTPDGHIRVPTWIDQPPRLTVVFKDKALAQLNQLGAEGEEKKTTIVNVLREDPRSVYLRERWGSHCYVFRIAELHVSCKFNDNSHLVTVYQIFQSDVPQGEEE